MRKQPIVALIYDFDGTLSPGNMQEFGFIQAIGKSPKEFWQESDEIAVGQDASNILSYMKLMFDEARHSGIKLRREDFKRFGASVELFDGVKEWFGLLDGDACVFEKTALVELANKGELMSYVHTGFWQCMDNIREKSMLEKLLEENKAPWKKWERSVPAIPDYAK